MTYCPQTRYATSNFTSNHASPTRYGYGSSCPNGCCAGAGYMTPAGFVGCPSGNNAPTHHAVLGASWAPPMGSAVPQPQSTVVYTAVKR